MRKLKHLPAIAFAACALWSGVVAAQTISQPTADSFLGNPGVGQSFTATLNGTVTAIAVASQVGGTFPLYFYNSANGSGVSGSVGSPVLPAQTVTLPATASLADPMTVITLTTPLPVSAGSTYSFVIGGSWQPHFSGSNVYAGGALIFQNANIFSFGDLRFQVYETAAATPVTATAIPSSSEWALLTTSLLIAAAAFLQHRRTRKKMAC